MLFNQAINQSTAQTVKTLNYGLLFEIHPRFYKVDQKCWDVSVILVVFARESTDFLVVGVQGYLFLPCVR